MAISKSLQPYILAQVPSQNLNNITKHTPNRNPITGRRQQRPTIQRKNTLKDRPSSIFVGTTFNRVKRNTECSFTSKFKGRSEVQGGGGEDVDFCHDGVFGDDGRGYGDFVRQDAGQGDDVAGGDYWGGGRG